MSVMVKPCPFDTEPCESCGQRGRAFEGAWFHLVFVLRGLGHHDAPVFARHTAEDCRAYRRGLPPMHPVEFAARFARHRPGCSSWFVVLRENADVICDCGGKE